ncbi:hypothetical protein ACPOL_2599 [Acidisarcina polymorpha]|uniref:Uncharacterized protein n=1 Tax=Acidisarcina polymorpha TaxID=2211140 RepID=A0A2Z5FZT9_9BACT|nr:hypothetical protein [Acidisarcina polymorpha]AXC11915.1 hypothetical protein ACPOL_2599 [Acidisarcina polymorpha]
MSEEERGDEFSVSRRNFLRGLGTALGGVALGGGAVGAAFGQGGIPSGYTFYRLITVGNTYANQNDIGGITPAVMLGSVNSVEGDPSAGVVFFHGTSKATSEPTVFRQIVSYRGGTPSPNGIDVLLTHGSTLTSIEGVPPEQLPLLVSNIGTGSGNASGNYATTIAAEDTGENSEDGSMSLKSLPGVYLYTFATKSWKKVVRFGDPSPDGGKYGGIFGDVVLNDDDSVTLVAATTEPPAGTSYSASASRTRRAFAGSHALVQVKDSSRSVVLLKSGDMLPGTHAMIESFGLIDVSKGRHFIAQVGARRADILGAKPGTAVVQGRLDFRGNNRGEGLRLHAASPHLLHERMLKTDSVILGESIIGPRIGVRGLAALVTHDPVFASGIGELEKQRFTTISNAGRDLIVRAGDGRGTRHVAALSAPVVSTEVGISYVAELLEDGSTQLIVTDGTTKTVILRSGDLIEGASVTEINHGYHPAQVDVSGRLAFAAEFLKDPNGDPNNEHNIETSLVIGIPA